MARRIGLFLSIQVVMEVSSKYYRFSIFLVLSVRNFILIVFFFLAHRRLKLGQRILSRSRQFLLLYFTIFRGHLTLFYSFQEHFYFDN